MSDKDILRRILCVDDEPNVLEGLTRTLGFDFEVHTTESGKTGLVVLEREGPFPVVVSDMRMPEMDGATFLKHVREKAPDTTRVLLTGQADIDSAISAVNEGQIFRFLTKPCPPDLLRKALEAAIEQYRLITAEKELLEKTLSGSIGVLTEILGLVNPAAFSKASRIKRYVTHMANRLDLPDRWQFEIAAMFSQIGCVTIPPDILDKVYAGQELSENEAKMFASHPSITKRLLGKIPRLNIVAQMIEGQQDKGGKKGAVPQFQTTDLSLLGSQMIKVALDFDHSVMIGMTREAALTKLRKKSTEYPNQLLITLEDLPEGLMGSATKPITIRELATGMILNEDVRAQNGMLIVAKGQEVTSILIERLQSFSKSVGVKEPFRVMLRI